MHFHWKEITFIRQKWNIMESLDIIFGKIQHIAIMIIIGICYATYRLSNKTGAPTTPGFQGTKRCVQYMASHPHKPILYPSNYYYGSNAIRLTWSGNQV